MRGTQAPDYGPQMVAMVHRILPGALSFGFPIDLPSEPGIRRYWVGLQGRRPELISEKSATMETVGLAFVGRIQQLLDHGFKLLDFFFELGDLLFGFRQLLLSELRGSGDLEDPAFSWHRLHR